MKEACEIDDMLFQSSATFQSAYELDHCFQEKWHLLPLESPASSLTLSGNVSIMGSFHMDLDIPRPNSFDSRVLADFDNAPLVTQGWVLRQLHLYYHCLDQMYTRFTSHITNSAFTVDMALHRRIIDIFVEFLNTLTTGTEMEITRMLSCRVNSKTASKFDRKIVVKDQTVSDRIATWVIDNFPKTVNTNHLQELADELSLDRRSCESTVRKREVRLRMFLDGTKPQLPQWIPKKFANETFLRDILSRRMRGEIVPPMIIEDTPTTLTESSTEKDMKAMYLGDVQDCFVFDQ